MSATIIPQATPIDEEPAPLPVQGRSDDYLKKLNEQPPGLQSNVCKICETPDHVVRRTLLPGETVMADFDCYFPYKMLPMWKIILLCICSGGLYLFVLLYRSIQRWCYRMRCCTPNHLEFTRGKVCNILLTF